MSKVVVAIPSSNVTFTWCVPTASVFKLMNKYYFQIILKYKNEANMLEVLKNINEMYITNKVSVDININPLNLL